LTQTGLRAQPGGIKKYKLVCTALVPTV
jgi:hypothetical protein